LLDRVNVGFKVVGIAVDGTAVEVNDGTSVGIAVGEGATEGNEDGISVGVAVYVVQLLDFHQYPNFNESYLQQCFQFLHLLNSNLSADHRLCLLRITCMCAISWNYNKCG